MACMDHQCTKCDFWTSNNESSMDCPLCGARCVSFWDEEYSDAEWDDEDDDEEIDEWEEFYDEDCPEID